MLLFFTLAVALAATPEIPQYLSLSLPFVATWLVRWFRSNPLPPQIDAIIAFIAAVLPAAIWMYLSDQLRGDVFADIIIVATATSALIAGPLRPFGDLLTYQVPSPISLLVAKKEPALVPVASRASALPPGATWQQRSKAQPQQTWLASQQELVDEDIDVKAQEPLWTKPMNAMPRFTVPQRPRKPQNPDEQR